MITFVTGFLNLHEDRSKDKSVDTCFQHFTNLVNSGLSLVVFLSSAYWDRRIESSNILYIPLELEDLEIYKECTSLQLPAVRTNYHDTRNFLTLINGKVEMVHKAMKLKESTHYAWIDFSIFHVVKNKDAMIKYLNILGKSQLKNCLISPGCWELGAQAEQLNNNVNWRYCGGFFLGDRASLEEFYSFHKTHVPAIFAETNTLVWEVNLWHRLELKGLRIQWYHADHNDSMLRIPSQYFSVVASLTTIPSRMEVSCRLTIDSLLSQVDHIYLNIPNDYKRFPGTVTLPSYLTEEPYKQHLTVVRCEDKGPATKYIGALDVIPNGAWVFFCDDDQEYAPCLIQQMKGCIDGPFVYQNRMKIIQQTTSGGVIHGYVGNLVHASLLHSLSSFPLPECAYHVDDQWMSIYYFKSDVFIKPTGIEAYSELFKRLEQGHECIGADSLAALGTRAHRVSQLEEHFKVKFIENGGITLI